MSYLPGLSYFVSLLLRWRMVHSWPSASLVGLPGRKLLVHEESPQASAELIRNFLNDTLSPRNLRKIPA